MTGAPYIIEPAQLFLQLWKIAEAQGSAERLNAQPPEPAFIRKLLKCLSLDNFDEASAALGEMFGPSGLMNFSLGEVLATLRAIDKAVASIHPRAVHIPGSTKPPSWVSKYKFKRLDAGCYASNDEYLVIPRGPLTRNPREEYASGGNSLADCFTYLGVGPRAASEHGRKISVCMKVVGSGIADGYPSSPRNGKEVVGFIPIAEIAGDLIHEKRENSGRHFIELRVSESIDPVSRLMDAINSTPELDIAIAPEIVMSETHAAALPEKILVARTPPRMLVAGSGATSERSGSQSWNETRVYNSVGTLLWTQRKVWQAGIAQLRALELGLPDPGEDQLLHEDNASGSDFVVCDVAGLGRVMIFICQDIQAKPMSGELIRIFQPDWIMLPILDPGIREGGWVHQRTLELSSESQARFLVCCSTALRRSKESTTLLNCGLAIGPKDCEPKEMGRLCGIFKAASDLSPHFAIANWGDLENGDWKKSIVTIQSMQKS